MEFVRKHKKLSIVIMLLSLVFLLISYTLGRYIYNFINNYILETKGFYFTSSVLKTTNKTYNINNWDGVNSYNIVIDVSSRKNQEKVTTEDVAYNIGLNCSTNVICEVNKTSGIIYEATAIDTYTITVRPNGNFSENDIAEIVTYATSTSPYTQTIRATYNLGVVKSNFSYNIVDSVNSKYLTLELTNSIAYYEVSTAFGSYAVGDRVSIEEYSELSAANKDKCFSAIVTLEFDPSVVIFDITSDVYINRVPNSEQTQVVNGYNYVKRFSFKLNATSSYKVIFYKDDITENYTYPITNPTSIINVTVNTAN